METIYMDRAVHRLLVVSMPQCGFKSRLLEAIISPSSRLRFRWEN